ncbi:MAG: SDR family oxidoreductase [Bryobacterales bacterium]|nr:SDR family oxidoreductase [Bryobacterales bacterium]
MGAVLEMRLAGKTIVVTGAASGIGAATLALCREEGATAVGLDLGSTDRVCDVSDEASVRRAFEGMERVDGLVNSAGIAVRQPAGAQDTAGWEAVFDVNVKGTFLCTREVLERMGPGASIVHLSSAVALTGVRNRAAYSASKGAIVALTRNMALDYAPRGIRVNCVCPGFARTALTRGIFEDPQRKARIEAMHPLGRMGEPEDIAKAVLFLLSGDASWITGIALAVDGGFSAGHRDDV